MTSDNEHHTYSPLGDKRSPQSDGGSGKWTVFLFVLSLILGAEVIVTAFLVYHMSAEINKTEEAARLGKYPLHCLQQLVDPDYQENATLSSEGLASCDLWIEELKNTAHKQLTSDIRNTFYQELAANNITLSHSNKPVIHMGPEQELRQFPDLIKKGAEENGLGRADILRWDNINGAAIQQGLMGYTTDGEVVVPRAGLYFVYSQVYFQLLPSAHGKHSQQFLQYIYRKTASYPEPLLLTKAAVTKCWNAELDFQLFSSHQGALFQLQQGDMLSLQVLDLKSVRLQEDSTFFGAFMVN
ncbi:tumor necrosis factor (ligand) superfamily, member 10 like 4 [Scleropages formosus]|uniref:CD40 ligand-like n=1 Tax=Scleropages formosus TaxID=113540 RepID=A0A8C9RLJ5_SCLFO|nr:CD40 ligand-like [Scleropages formosus]XP_018602100.1 CD40 ligand-like [Scleropages formosus]